jgi:hypothetical protein
MFDFNIEYNKTYSVVYNKKNKKYLGFFVKYSDNEIKDIITDNIILVNDIMSISEFDNAENSPQIKFYKKAYKKSNYDTKVFTYENNNEHICISILRFFDISYEDLFNENTNIEKCNLIRDKIKKYVYRYYDENLCKEYCEQLEYFNTVPSVLSFLPLQIKNFDINKIYIFWAYDYQTHPNFKKILFEVDIEYCKVFNLLNLNWNHLFEDKNEYKNILIKNMEQFKNKSIPELQDKIPKIIKKRIKDGYETLDKEEIDALQKNDNDLLTEIIVIREILNGLDKNFDYSLSRLDLNEGLSSIWPEILLPLPKSNEIEIFNNYFMLKNFINWVYVENSE